MSQALIIGIAIFSAAVFCFLLLVAAVILGGALEVSEEEARALDERARKAGM